MGSLVLWHHQSHDHQRVTGPATGGRGWCGLWDWQELWACMGCGAVAPGGGGRLRPGPRHRNGMTRPVPTENWGDEPSAGQGGVWTPGRGSADLRLPDAQRARGARMTMGLL